MPLTRSNQKSKKTLGTAEPKILQRKSSTSDSEKNHSNSSSKNSKVPRSKSKRRSIFEVSDSEENHSNSNSKNSKLPKRNVKDPIKSKSRSKVKNRSALILQSNVPDAESWGNQALSGVNWGTLVASRKRQRTATPELILGSEQSSEDSEGTPAPPAAKKAKNDENAQRS